MTLAVVNLENRPIEELPNYLRSLPCFSSLDQQSTNRILKSATIKKYSDKDVLYFQDDAAEFLYVILKGCVRLSYLREDGTCISLGILQQGRYLGELGVCDGGDYAETATAIGNVWVALLSKQLIVRWMEDQPVEDCDWAGLLVGRYRDYQRAICRLSLGSLSARLSRILLDIANQSNETWRIGNRDCRYVSSIITQSDLGAMARGTRGNVNRTLKRWERSGWILLRDRCIILLNEAALGALAREQEL